jgi:hypothetical protein
MTIKNITKSSEKIDQSGINESPLASALFRHIKEYYPVLSSDVNKTDENDLTSSRIQEVCQGV